MAAGLRQYEWSAIMTRPPKSTNEPATHDHNAFAVNSDSSFGISEARAAAVMQAMTKNGPSTRANMRVLVCGW
jgi:hypothetical protein